MSDEIPAEEGGIESTFREWRDSPNMRVIHAYGVIATKDGEVMRGVFDNPKNFAMTVARLNADGWKVLIDDVVLDIDNVLTDR